jgi:hypothetical protein
LPIASCWPFSSTYASFNLSTLVITMPQNLKKTLRKSITYCKLLTFFLRIRFFQFIHLGDHNTLKFEKDIKEKYCLSQVANLFPPHMLLSIYPPRWSQYPKIRKKPLRCLIKPLRFIFVLLKKWKNSLYPLKFEVFFNLNLNV